MGSSKPLIYFRCFCLRDAFCRSFEDNQVFFVERVKKAVKLPTPSFISLDIDKGEMLIFLLTGVQSV
jgi:hypothetical protein